MLFPAELPLASSRKNIYGHFPPSNDELAKVEQTLLLEDRAFLKERRWPQDKGELLTGQYDGTSVLNSEELAFAHALDRSSFVNWWHRNPDRKRYSVRLVRGEHRNFFHPDFVVCLAHYPGDEPLIRKVLFITKDQDRLRCIREDGSQGSEVDLDDLGALHDWLQATRPEQI